MGELGEAHGSRGTFAARLGLGRPGRRASGAVNCIRTADRYYLYGRISDSMGRPEEAIAMKRRAPAGLNPLSPVIGASIAMNPVPARK